ncbi:MAG: hypothetical protein WBM11_02480 [Terriglobales bacterium]
MSARNFGRAVAIILLVEAALSLRKYGWASYGWPATTCLAGCLLLLEPKRQGEGLWTRLRRPSRLVGSVFALLTIVFVVLSMLAGGKR